MYWKNLINSIQPFIRFYDIYIKGLVVYGDTITVENQRISIIEVPILGEVYRKVHS